MIGVEDAQNSTVLVVDDDAPCRQIISLLLEEHGYASRTASNGMEALEFIAASQPDLILLDVEMPQLNGFQVAERLKSNAGTQSIPIIMVTGLDAHACRMRGLTAGVEEFLTKPVDPTELAVRVRNLLRLRAYTNLLANHRRILEEQVRERTAQLRESYIETIFMLTRAAEYKDEETGAHVQRISHYTRTLAEKLGMNGEFVDTIFYASPMHDIGKLAIPDHILLKPGPLSSEEWNVMKTHTIFGQKILSDSRTSFARMGAEIALTHHERWDGKGYPRGLKGEAIPLCGRIMNICDQYDALRSARPYKPALDHKTAVSIITNGDARTMPAHFDPAILDAFRNCASTFRDIYTSLHD